MAAAPVSPFAVSVFALSPLTATTVVTGLPPSVGLTTVVMEDTGAVVVDTGATTVPFEVVDECEAVSEWLDVTELVVDAELLEVERKPLHRPFSQVLKAHCWLLVQAALKLPHTSWSMLLDA